MKIRKYIMVLVLGSLFMGVSYADDKVGDTAKDLNAISKVDDSIIDFSELDELDKEIAEGKKEIAELEKEVNVLTALIVTGGKTE